MLPESRGLTLAADAVVVGKGAGDVHALGAGHTVAAAGAAHLHVGVDGSHHLLQHLLLGIAQIAHLGRGGGLDVVLHHLHAVHARQHAGHLRLIPQPPQRPLGGGVACRVGRKNLLCLPGQIVHQLAAPQGLHNDHRQALLMGMVQATAACLGIFVHVIVLDLAEIPVISIHQFAEHFGVAVVGKTHLSDLTRLLFAFQPLGDAKFLHSVPGINVGEHMHEIIINVVGFQPGKLLLKELFHAFGAADQIMGQLGGDIYFVPQAVFLQNLAQGAFTAGIDVGGVKIVHAAVDGGKDLPLGLRKVDGPQIALKAHTTKAQRRDLISVFVQTIVHETPPKGICCIYHSPFPIKMQSFAKNGAQ